MTRQPVNVLDDALDRPVMPAAVRRVLPAVSAGRDRVTLTAMPADVVATLRDWGDGRSIVAVVTVMVRRLRDPALAPLRASILAEAGEVARVSRRRRWP